MNKLSFIIYLTKQIKNENNSTVKKEHPSHKQTKTINNQNQIKRKFKKK